MKCPFYRRDDVNIRKITCEGIMDKSTLSMTFRRLDDYDRHLDTYCCEHFDKCEIYRMLMNEKYEEEA